MTRRTSFDSMAKLLNVSDCMHRPSSRIVPRLCTCCTLRDQAGHADTFEHDVGLAAKTARRAADRIVGVDHKHVGSHVEGALLLKPGNVLHGHFARAEPLRPEGDGKADWSRPECRRLRGPTG